MKNISIVVEQDERSKVPTSSTSYESRRSNAVMNTTNGVDLDEEVKGKKKKKKKPEMGKPTPVVDQFVVRIGNGTTNHDGSDEEEEEEEGGGGGEGEDKRWKAMSKVENGRRVLPITSAGCSDSMSSVLRVIPLAYSPRTKQLHIISVQSDSEEEEEENGRIKKGEKETDCCVDGCRVLQCIEEVDEMGDVENVDNVDRAKEDVFVSGGGGGGGLSVGQRVGNVSNASTLSRVDASSFSSISSLSTNNTDTTAGAVSSTNGSTPEMDKCGEERVEAAGGGGKGEKNKRNGLTDFIARNLFSWKSKEPPPMVPSPPPPPWRLFRKPTTSTTSETDKKNVEELDTATKSSSSSDGNSLLSKPVQNNNLRISSNRRQLNFEPASTTALILENRPLNLPAKPAEEEMRHRQEYEQMVEALKKREVKEAKLRKRIQQQQLKNEELIVQAARVWNNEILPNWETMKLSRKARDLWWQGIPPSVRGKVWKLAIGNELNITAELYEICVNRAQHRIRMASESASVSEEDSEDSSTDKESSVELIKLDVSRTFPQLCIFQKGGPYYDLLHSLLGAYVCYRPDIGYLQGMSFLAAVLILNLEVDDAFICFANLLNKPCQLAFFRLIEALMKSYFKTYEEFFLENLPKLFNHFRKQKVEPDLYLIDWIYTLYSKSLPLDVASRVWDVFFRDGEEFLFQTALGILHLYQDVLLDMDFIHIAQFLTKLPDDIAVANLFQSIEMIRMNIDKKSFGQMLAFHSDPTDT